MALPDHLFTSSVDGALYDTRDPEWSQKPPVRKRYTRPAGQRLADLCDVKACLRAGAYTDVGGYPLYFITRDGAALSFAAVREQFKSVCYDFLEDASTGWRVEAVEVNWEDFDLRCDHTGARIDSAHGEPDEEDAD